jgi:hypothetical protein
LIPRVEYVLSKMEKKGAIQVFRNKILKDLLDEK